jgi:hypothetical protein
MSAYARVELRGSASHRAMGRPEFTKRGQVRYLSNADDIAYFKSQAAFKVVDLEPPSNAGKPEKKGVTVASSKPKPSVPPPPPPPPPEGEGEDLPPWKPSMSKAELIEAAAARGIAVTPEDKKADVIELLRMHDEDSSSDEGEDEESDDEDEESDDDEDASDEDDKG